MSEIILLAYLTQYVQNIIISAYGTSHIRSGQWGAWLAQSEKPATLALWVLSLSFKLGIEIIKINK